MLALATRENRSNRFMERAVVVVEAVVAGRTDPGIEPGENADAVCSIAAARQTAVVNRTIVFVLYSRIFQIN